MKKIKLAVIFGGKSSEYPVSLHSSASLLSQLHQDRYELLLIGITKMGKWLHYHGSIEDLEHDHWEQHPDNCAVVLSCSTADRGFLELREDGTYQHLPVDCLFPVLHGKNGEDGTIQGLFELSGVPYVGCDHMSSAICMDKEMTHIICEHANIPCAPYMAVYEREAKDETALYHEAQQRLGVPFFIKPCNAGSSFGVHKVHDFEEFTPALQDAFYHDGRGKVIFEATIDGFEIGCAVMGNEELFTGSVDEIETSAELFDYAGKYEMVDAANRIQTEERKGSHGRINFWSIGVGNYDADELFALSLNKRVFELSDVDFSGMFEFLSESFIDISHSQVGQDIEPDMDYLPDNAKVVTERY